MTWGIVGHEAAKFTPQTEHRDMKTILVWLHTQHEETIEDFIRVMGKSGFLFVSRSYIGITGNCFVKFYSPERNENDQSNV